MKTFIIADVGSTTTKVLFIKDGKILAREEAKTTVEKPVEDVAIGVRMAIELIERKLKQTISSEKFLFSSSAGGGLQIIAIGLTKSFTAKSAYDLSLNAGAIVIDTLALDDNRTPLQRLQCLDQAKPDLVLFAGGFEDGAVNSLVEIAELIKMSKINVKYKTGKLPIIYAGNSKALPFVERALGDRFALRPVPNISPSEEVVNFVPAKEAIINTFISHVMSSAPGYGDLSKKALIPPLPTPIAVERILALYSRYKKKKIYAFDMGGATTDCFSISDDISRRSVAANLGMTFSLPYVLNHCGLKKIMSCLDKTYDKTEFLNFLGNRFVRPTSISETEEELKIEEAIAQNIIKESFILHRNLIKTDYDMVIASGGFIAHHPNKTKLKQIIEKALPVRSSTVIAIDNMFVLPHLGVLSQIDEALAIKYCEENVTLL
jgi:uncharacterized protein (TIGR01319 family)